MKEDDFPSNVLYVVLWNKVVGELDHFIGQISVPISSMNLNDGEIQQWYSLETKGTTC